MLTKSLAGAGALLVLLSGCGHADPTYGSTTDIAAALGCTDGTDPQVHSKNGYTLETCRFRGHPLSIYSFQKKDSSYYRGVEGIASHVHGSGWDVWCSRGADCMKVQQKIGGDLIHDVPPANG